MLLARFPNAHLGKSSCVHMIIICPHRNGTLFPVWTLTRVSIIRKDGVRKGRIHSVASLEWMRTFDTMSYGCVIILSPLLSLSCTSGLWGSTPIRRVVLTLGEKKNQWPILLVRAWTVAVAGDTAGGGEENGIKGCYIEGWGLNYTCRKVRSISRFLGSGRD